ncbi:MAG: class I SAM-dependent methyltransferase [Phormidesmis sp.]
MGQQRLNQQELSQTQLETAIAQKIQQSDRSRITFAQFMELALYHPQFGYYASSDRIIGPQGDFVTSPHMGHDFGQLLAEQLADMWETLQKPELFTLIEMGAGQGLIAADVLAHLQAQYPDCFEQLRYIVVEKSNALRAEQKKRLAHWQEKGVDLSWQTLDEIEDGSVVGCAFSNELVDAFPVHWVEWHGKLQEMWVSVQGTQLVPTLDDLSTPALKTYFEKIGIDLSQHYADGYRTEVNLAALDWLTQVSNCLSRGYLLTIDYGYTAQRYYSPARNEGTLQCYYRHAHHSDPFAHVGAQDITAHVDFTALEKVGESVGLEKVGFTQQGLFLMALGLGDRLAKLSQPQSPNKSATGQTIQAIMMRREALQQLISPMGLGNFGVLIQAKGLTQKEIANPLKGLTIPPIM